MESALEDQEVNASIGIIHSGRIQGQCFNKKMKGDNHSLVGKQVEKMIGGKQGGFYPQEDSLLGYSQAGGTDGSRAKIDQNPKISR